MKKILTIAAMLLACYSVVEAQTDQGTVLLGGGISFQTSDNSSSFIAAPNVGLFILNDVALTASFSLFATKGTTSWALGPSIRLYLFGTDRGKFIAQVGVNVGGARNSDTDFGFDVAGGYAVFMNESIALEFLARYTKTGDIKGIFSLGVGFQIHYDR
jgi:hypothetical protein